jgi:hypothetical protein
VQLLSVLAAERDCASGASGRGMPQRCCALASVLAAKGCHCTLAAPKEGKCKLSSPPHNVFQDALVCFMFLPALFSSI